MAGLLNRGMSSWGFELAQSNLLYPWQQVEFSPSHRTSAAIEELSYDSPRLAELKRRYRAFDTRVTAPAIWVDGHGGSTDLGTFRGDSPYLWQTRGDNNNPISYIATYYYTKTIDTHRLLDRLVENGSFGAYTVQVDGRLVSRDLLDSIQEISFLQRHLGVLDTNSLKVLDIGAGYGRLAGRMAAAREGELRYLCTDAVALSTFLSEFYLDRLGLTDRASAVPLDEVDTAADGTDLAVNINSFPECSIPAIEWWLDLLKNKAVPHLFLVPNANETEGAVIATVTGENFQTLIEARGYRLIVKEPKYAEPMLQDYGISPTHFYLFER